MGSLPFTEESWLSSHSPSSLQDRSPANPSPLVPFQQRSSNRSPVESPPVSKKALMRVAMPQQQESSTDRFFGQRLEELVANIKSCPPSSSSASGKENVSILKRSPNGREAKAARVKRRVEFEPSVQVFCFDKEVGDHVSSCSERLSVEPKDRREFMNRTFQNKFKVVSNDAATSNTNGQRGGNCAGAKPQKKGIYTGGVIREPPLLYSPTLSAASSAEQSTSRVTASRPLPLPPAPTTLPLAEGYVPGAVDFTFFEDEGRRLRIKFTIPLGEGVAATDVLVKANMTGNKVRVVASRTVGGTLGGAAVGAQREEFSERYLLPMEVDPYLITARLDAMGNLFVEAPIMSAERKRALAAEKQSKLASTNAGLSNGGHAGFSL